MRRVIFPWLLGGRGLTLPVPFFGIIIFVLRGHEQDATLLAHEWCHVRQIRRWGAWGYLARHLWARIVTRSLWAYDHSIERECYEAKPD